MPADAKLTSELFWASALVIAIVAAGFVLLLAWRVPPHRFRQLKWVLTGVAIIFWSSLWTYALWGYWWELAYRYVFPTWARWVVPPAYGLLFGAVTLLTWWLALRLPGHPIVNFSLLGGLASLPGHLWAFYGRGMLKKVPILQGVSEASTLVFGVFEFIFYWSFLLTVAALLQRGWEWWRGERQAGPHVR